MENIINGSWRKVTQEPPAHTTSSGVHTTLAYRQARRGKGHSPEGDYLLGLLKVPGKAEKDICLKPWRAASSQCITNTPAA